MPLHATFPLVPRSATARLPRASATAVMRGMSARQWRDPFPIIVPCHRVLAASGKIGGFSAAGGVVTKLRLLEIEGAQVGEAPTLFNGLPLAMRPRQGS